MSESTETTRETVHVGGGGWGRRVLRVVAGVLLVGVAVFILFGLPLLLHPERAGRVTETVSSITSRLTGSSEKLVEVYDHELPPVLPRGVPEPPPKPLKSIVVERGLTGGEWWSRIGVKGTRAVAGEFLYLQMEYEAGLEWKACRSALGGMLCGNVLNKYAMTRTQGVQSLFWTRDLYVREMPRTPYILVALEEVSGDKINVTVLFYKATKQKAVQVAWWIHNISVNRPVILSLGHYDPRYIGRGWGAQGIRGDVGVEDAVRWLRKHKDMNPIIVEVMIPNVIWAHGDPDAVSKTKYWFNEVEKPFIDTVAREIILRTRYWNNTYPAEATSVTILLYKGCALGHLAWYTGVPPYAEYLGDWGFADIILPRLDWDEQYERVCVNRTLYVDWYGNMPWLLYNASIYDNLEEAFREGRLKRINWARNLLGEIEDYETWDKRWITGSKEPSFAWLVEKYLEYRKQLYPDVPTLELEAWLKTHENREKNTVGTAPPIQLPGTPARITEEEALERLKEMNKTKPRVPEIPYHRP